MKTLLVIRHAKAEDGFGLKDSDRSLSERGLNDAPAMAWRVADKKINIDWPIKERIIISEKLA